MALADLRRRGLGLEYLTIGWLAVVMSLAVAYSAPLIGLGDLAFHVFGALVVIRAGRAGQDRDQGQRSLRLIAGSFFALAAYVTADAVQELLVGGRVTASLVMPTLVYMIGMLTLGSAKRRVGLDLPSRALVVDSTGTLLCASLSGVFLVRLVLAASTGWWQVGPLAALGIAWLAVRKGREAWEGEPGSLRARVSYR